MAGKKVDTVCPGCGRNVMTVGFTLRSEVTVSYMRFRKSGLVQIANTQNASHEAECLNCGRLLKVTPVELLRMA